MSKTATQARPPGYPRSHSRFRGLWYLLGVAFLGLFAYESIYAARIAWLREHDPELTAFMSQRLALLRERDPRAQLVHQWVDYRLISPALKRAVMVAEDARFPQHDGFDWEGIRTAFARNLHEGEIVAGGSTISQQLVKNLYLSGERSVSRKLQEALLTVMLEALLGKRRIFEIYLNMIEWGDGVYGAEAAARHYFRVSAKAVEPHQAALLAAMIPRPRYYDHKRGDIELKQRAAVIARRMDRVTVP